MFFLIDDRECFEHFGYFITMIFCRVLKSALPPVEQKHNYEVCLREVERVCFERLEMDIPNLVSTLHKCSQSL